MGSPQSPLALAAGRGQGFWRRWAGGAPGCRVHLRHRPQWVLPACPQDVGTSSDTVTVLHGTGVLGHPPPRCPTPPCSTPAQGWGPSSPPFPLRAPARPPLRGPQAPGGDTPVLGRAGGLAPWWQLWWHRLVSQVVPVVGKRGPPRPSPALTSPPPVWSCCSRCRAPAPSAFGEGEAPPLGVWGGAGGCPHPLPSLLTPCT